MSSPDEGQYLSEDKKNLLSTCCKANLIFTMSRFAKINMQKIVSIANKCLTYLSFKLKSIEIYIILFPKIKKTVLQFFSNKRGAENYSYQLEINSSQLIC